MEKRTLYGLMVLVMACSSTGFVHGWPWSSSKPTKLSVEIKNEYTKTLYCIYGHNDAEIRQGVNTTEANKFYTMRFTVDVEYPPIFWISNEGFTGFGRWYAIDPQKYSSGKVSLKVNTYGELIDNAYPRNPVRDKGYDGGVVYGGTLTRQEQKSEPKVINARKLEIFLDNKSGVTYYYAKALNKDDIYNAYPSSIDNHLTGNFTISTSQPPYLWVGKEERGKGVLYVINPKKYPRENHPIYLEIQPNGELVELRPSGDHLVRMPAIPHTDKAANESKYDGGMIYVGQFTKKPKKYE